MKRLLLSAEFDGEPTRCIDVKAIGMVVFLWGGYVVPILLQATIDFVDGLLALYKKADMKGAGIFALCSLTRLHQSQHESPIVIVVRQESHPAVPSHVSHPE